MRTRLMAGALALVAVVLSLWACSDGGPTANRSGTLAVEMTDAPTEQLSAINVFIVGLTIKPVDGPVERIANEVGVVDLLELQDATQLLATAGVEVGSYDHLRVELDQDRSNVVESASGEEKPLKIASEEIKVNGGFEVFGGDRTTVTLDFDAEQSIRRQGNGSWLLVPVIVQIGVRRD